MKTLRSALLVILATICTSPALWAMTVAGTSGPLHSYDGQKVTVANQTYTLVQPKATNKYRYLACRSQGIRISCETLRGYRGSVRLKLDEGVVTVIELLE